MCGVLEVSRSGYYNFVERKPPPRAVRRQAIQETVERLHAASRMVRRELWTTLLGYNLIRITAAGAALVHQKQPRQISFTSTCQYILASWMLTSCGLIDRAKMGSYCRKLLEQVAGSVKLPTAPVAWNPA